MGRYNKKMIAYVLATQLYQEPKLPSFSESVHIALAGPRVVSTSAPQQPLPTLEQMATQAHQKTYGPHQIDSILKRPYLNPDTSPIYRVYSDLEAKGAVMTHMLRELAHGRKEILRGLKQPASDLTLYFVKVEEFLVYQRLKLDESMARSTECINDFTKSIAKENPLEADAKQFEKASAKVNECLDREDKYVKAVEPKIRSLISTRREMMRIMEGLKPKSIK